MKEILPVESKLYQTVIQIQMIEQKSASEGNYGSNKERQYHCSLFSILTDFKKQYVVLFCFVGPKYMEMQCVQQ